METANVKSKTLSSTVDELKKQGKFIIAIVPTKFKISGTNKDVLTATDFTVLSRG